MSGHLAEELVAAWLQRGAEARVAALADDGALPLRRPGDRDVVLDRRRVGHRDRDLAGLRGRLAERERQRAAGVGRDRQLAGLHGGDLVRVVRRADRREEARVLPW